MTTMLINAEVHTMSASRPRAEAIAWREGKILAVGTQQEVSLLAGPDAHSVDAMGAAVLPGFIDAHHHPCVAALYGATLRLSPPKVSDIKGLQRALSEAAQHGDQEQWLVASDWHEGRLAERRPPTLRELDEAVPDRPLLALHWSCHRALANSKALALAGISRSTADPSGGEIVRGAQGEPTGLLIERGMSPVESLARRSLISTDAESFLLRLASHHQAMAAVGLTRVVDATVPGDLGALYRVADQRGLLLVPTVMMPVSTSGYLEAPWDVLDGPVTGHQEGMLEVGPVKLVLDGAPTCAMCLSWWRGAGSMLSAWALSARQGSLDPIRTALSLQPRLGLKIRTGIRIYRRDEAEKIVRAIAERGFAIAAHAIGNEAVELAIDAYDASREQVRRRAAPRIEHGTMLDRNLVARIADLGAAVVVQPHFISTESYGTAASIPGMRNFPLRWLIDAGVTVAGSSDYPVAGFAPLDGIRSAVSRRTCYGHIFEEDQRLRLEEALALYTRNAAEASGCLDRCGTLELGKRADIVVLSGPLAQIDQAQVRSTYIEGKEVYGAVSR